MKKAVPKHTVDTQLPATVATPTAPKLPHERDESVGTTGGVASAVVQQAYQDVQRGLTDTSCGTAANHTYEKLKQGAPDA